MGLPGLPCTGVIWRYEGRAIVREGSMGVAFPLSQQPAPHSIFHRPCFLFLECSLLPSGSLIQKGQVKAKGHEQSPFALRGGELSLPNTSRKQQELCLFSHNSGKSTLGSLTIFPSLWWQSCGHWFCEEASLNTVGYVLDPETSKTDQ